MYNSILVPLDGSKRAERILPHVEDLAQHYKPKVILLSVARIRSNTEMGLRVSAEEAQKALQRKAEQSEAYLAGIQGEFREKGINVKAEVVFGPVVESILDAAERESVDLIAMASHGRGGVSRVFYGSVAAGVLQRVDRPLLLIRSRQAE